MHFDFPSNTFLTSGISYFRIWNENTIADITGKIEERTHHLELSLAATVSVDNDTIGSNSTVLDVALAASMDDTGDDVDLLVTLRSL